MVLSFKVQTMGSNRRAVLNRLTVKDTIFRRFPTSAEFDWFGDRPMA
jgi:hypothetical protein